MKDAEVNRQLKAEEGAPDEDGDTGGAPKRKDILGTLYHRELKIHVTKFGKFYVPLKLTGYDTLTEAREAIDRLCAELERE